MKNIFPTMKSTMNTHKAIFSLILSLLFAQSVDAQVNHNPDLSNPNTGSNISLGDCTVVSNGDNYDFTIYIEDKVEPGKESGFEDENGEARLEILQDDSVLKDVSVTAGSNEGISLSTSLCSSCSFDLKLYANYGGVETALPVKTISLSSGGNQSNLDASGGSINVKISLGSISNGAGSAVMGIYADYPNAALFSPESLVVNYTEAEFDANGVFERAVTGEGITEISNIVEGQSYQIDFKHANSTLFKTVLVENPGNQPIADTVDDTLYHTERNGQTFDYNIEAENGEYLVRLYFSENFYTSANERLFDVIAEGQTILDDLDLFATAGKDTAYVVEVPVAVTGDKLDLTFVASKSVAEVSAIEVAKPASDQAIDNTVDDELYRTGRSGNFGYKFNISNGDYRITLHFAERYFDTAGARVIDVSELDVTDPQNPVGTVFLNNFDIYQTAGATNKANVQTFDVTVADGSIDLDLTSIAGMATLAGIRIDEIQPGPSLVFETAINVGGEEFTAQDSTVYAADSGSAGGASDAEHGTQIAINCGGEAYTASSGTEFLDDQDYKRGKAFFAGFRGLKLTETVVGGSSKIYQFDVDSDPISGELASTTIIQPGGLKGENVQTVWEADRLTYHETKTVFDPQDVEDSNDDIVAYKKTETYEKFGFGFEKSEEVMDQGGLNLTTTWEYYEEQPGTTPSDPQPYSYGRVKSMVRYDGYWEEYEYDQTGGVTTTTTVSPFKDSSQGDKANSRVETVTRSDTAIFETRVVTVKEEEVSRTYKRRTESTGEILYENITATVAGAGIDDSTNLVSKRCIYTSDNATPLLRNRVKWTQNPDGTATIYSYAMSGDDLVTTLDTGEPNGSISSIVNGTRTITTTNPQGEKIAYEEKDISAGSAGATLMSWSAGSVDDFGRVTQYNYGDSTTRSVTYVGSDTSCSSCSGGNWLVATETDRNGVVTVYTYDSLGRRTESTNLQVTNKSTLDPMGRVTKRERIGEVGGGSPSTIVVQENVYDLAGRMTSTKDALNNVTSMAYTNGGRTVTTTYPTVAAGTGTRVEDRYLDRQTKSVTGSAVADMKYDYGVTSNQLWTQQIMVGDGGAETEWTKSYTDLAGRSVKMEYADSAVATMAYNAKGQMIKQVDPDGVTMLYAYNGEGERTDSALDMDADDTIDYDGTDRITRVINSVASAHGAVVRRRTTEVWATDSTDTTTTVSIAEQDGYGNNSWQTDSSGEVTASAIARTSGGNWTVTTTAPSGAQTVETYTSGRLNKTEQKESGGTVLGSTTYGYDAHGRVGTQTDARIGATTVTYTARDEVDTVTSPASQVTDNDYDALGRLTQVTLPDSTAQTTAYDLRGNVTGVSGSQQYDVTYTYTEQNRLKTMTTTGQAGSEVTTWNYGAQRGWLDSKVYDGGKGTDYTYTGAGRLETRVWDRGVTTTYGYNAAGDLATTDYSDATPDVTLTYTRFGQMATVADAAGSRTYTYDSATLLPDNETLPTATYGSTIPRVLTRLYEDGSGSTVAGRYAGFELGTGADPDQDHKVAYAYDTAGRLSTVTAPGSRTYTYGYETNAPGLRKTVTGPVHTATWTFAPNKNVIESVENKVGATTISMYEYDYNSLDQRTGREQSGTAFALTGANAPSIDTFAYNSNGELVTADNDTHAALDFGFNYDGIGNRTSATDSVGTLTYTSNKLNQYTAVSGWTAAPAYDDDGNMVEAFLNGQYRLLTYNGENRLVTVEPEATPVSGDKKIEYAYDYIGRRVSKKVSIHDGSAYNLDSHEVFVYDGWNMVAVLDAGSSYALAKTYSWGSDLSGSMQGAGGVGGLLACEEKSGPHTDTYSFTYDANGNVTQVVDSLGTIDAHYEYTPFGQVAASSGAYKDANLYKFSTKYEDTETTTLYYGFRSYDPTLGRWLNRDPIDVAGGVNLYALYLNNLVNTIDLLGNQILTLAPCDGKTRKNNKNGKWEMRTDMQDPSKKKRTNGCTGIPDKHTFLLPMGHHPHKVTVDFSPACNMHDECYETCNSGKGNCDKKFLSDLLAICNTIPAGTAARLECKVRANTLYKGVHNLGGGFYEDSQDYACVWEECCKF